MPTPLTPTPSDKLSTCLTGDNIARFRDPRTLAQDLPPFPGYLTQPTRTADLPLGFPIRPRFFHRAGRACVDFFGVKDASLYGTGEQAGPLLRNGTRKVLWNTDAFGFTDQSKSLYQSHPFILGLRHASHPRTPPAFGIIVETTHRCEIHLKSAAAPHSNSRSPITISVNGPSPAVTIILRDTPQEVVQALATLTGHTPLPPLWALGYHQCRYSYMSEEQVREVAAGFRARNIPCDALWLDIDYMDGYRSFTFDKQRFPDPARLAADLHKDGFRLVTMIDPGLRVEESYPPYVQGREGRHFVTVADRVTTASDKSEIRNPKSQIESPAANDFQGPVWPGPCAFPDFTNAATRAWWASLHRDLIDLNIDGIWNDMNEPAVFAPSKTMPLTNRHDADKDLGGPDNHARYHNIYGMQMTRATREALEELRPERRPFVLTRAGFLGSQRYAATWTGDNAATWDHLRWTIPMVLNLGLSGTPFCGVDIGGFMGDTDPALFARWMGIGALLPFCRAHKNKGTKMHETWELGPECETACRLALERRYRLLPYLYTLFFEATRTGLPIARPLFFADPTDPRLRTVDNAFLLGDSVLVQACVTPGNTDRLTPLPRGRWTPFELTDPHPDLPKLFLRAGHAIPTGTVIQHTGERADSLTLLAALDDQGRAECTLYEDAGDGPPGTDFCLTRYHITEGEDPRIEPLESAGETQPRKADEVFIL